MLWADVGKSRILWYMSPASSDPNALLSTRRGYLLPALLLGVGVFVVIGTVRAVGGIRSDREWYFLLVGATVM